MTGLQFGELAAVGTAVLWTLSTLAWTSSGRRIGALAVSFHRLMIASVFLALYGGLVRGQALPTDADHRTWLILGLSGLLGFFVCDLCAMTIVIAGSMVGPFLGVVACMIALRHAPTGVVVTIINTMPVLILPFAILLYRERVSPRAAAGAIVTVAGVGLMRLGT